MSVRHRIGCSYWDSAVGPTITCDCGAWAAERREYDVCECGHRRFVHNPEEESCWFCSTGHPFSASRSLTEPRTDGHGDRDDAPAREPSNDVYDLSKPYRDTYPYGDTSTDTAREAYEAHRAELSDVGPEHDPGPWKELSVAIRDIWIAYVKGAK